MTSVLEALGFTEEGDGGEEGGEASDNAVLRRERLIRKYQVWAPMVGMRFKIEKSSATARSYRLLLHYLLLTTYY